MLLSEIEVSHAYGTQVYSYTSHMHVGIGHTYTNYFLVQSNLLMQSTVALTSHYIQDDDQTNS